MTAASVGRGARAAGAHRHRRVTRPYGAAVRHFSKGRSRENSALILDAQLHLFDGAASANPLSGLSVKLPDTCSNCGDLVAIIGPGKPPHCASLLCRSCRLHRGWISGANYTFLSEIINKFGAPTEPIVFRSRSTKPEENDDGVSVVQDGMIKEKPHASDS
jgi:hypothetical protein